ncbi:MAG: hypothetical protein AAF716_10970 [Cyanobacteria bacterium P01_D01_bin.1]
MGYDISGAMGRKLYGRADIRASDCRINKLRVVEKPLTNNANHADIEGWPDEKADKKIIALKLTASASQLVKAPDSSLD